MSARVSNLLASAASRQIRGGWLPDEKVEAVPVGEAALPEPPTDPDSYRSKSRGSETFFRLTPTTIGPARVAAENAPLLPSRTAN
jgi:hypothetical protein